MGSKQLRIVLMLAFPLKWKKQKMKTRYKIIYLSMQDTEHYVYIHAHSEDNARQQFHNYFSAPGDKIKEVRIESYVRQL
jgi:hypothetical protein